MSWEEEEKPKGMTRREWVRLGMTIGAVGALASVGGLVSGQVLPPPIVASGTVREDVLYTKFPTPQWWNSKDGEPVKVTDFQLWEGATGVWRGVYQGSQLLPGTGFPVLIIRVPYHAPQGTIPSASDLANAKITLPAGYSMLYDNGSDTQIVVLFDRCVHLCCYPGWHVVTNPPPLRDYLVNPEPTYAIYHQDPVYCICHGSQYDPLLLQVNYNPVNSVNYVGAAHVHGPATRALAIIPIQEKGGSLFGGMPDPRWYEYC